MGKHQYNLETFAAGALSERVNQAIEEVVKNIADPNTEWKTKRKITVNMVFETKEDREISNIDIVAKPTLAPKKSVHATIFIDRDGSGEVIASEYKKQLPGQQAIKVDSETGEVLGTSPEDRKRLQILK